MTRMTRSVVERANPDILGRCASSLRPVAAMIDRTADTVHRTVTGIKWIGEARDAAVGRADSERIQMRRAADAVDRLASAFDDGEKSMSPMVDSLKQSAQNLSAAHYDVAQDWTVTDGYEYGLAEAFAANDAAKVNQLRALQRERAAEAANETVRLQKLANELAAADEATARAIQAARVAIAQMAPVTAGLSDRQAQLDLQALQQGKATGPQLTRLRAATHITDEQLAALREGRRANIPQGQFEYLRALMDGLDGVSLTEMRKMDASAPGVLGDALRLISMPNLRTEGGSQGGMDLLPASVRSLLQEDPTVDEFLSGESPVAIQRFAVPRLEDFGALNAILRTGNQSLRTGADIDRGLLKQASEISRLFGPDMPLDAYGDVQKPLGLNEIQRTVNDMLVNAGGDHQAVTSFLTGEGMNGTVTPGNTYDADAHMLNLLKAQWNPGDPGMRAAFDWTGSAADDPGYEGVLGGRATEALAQQLIRHHDELAYIGPPGAEQATESFGTRNPELAQMFAKNMVPYLGNFADLPPELLINQTAGPLGYTSELSALMGVLGTDPVAADVLTKGTAAWDNYLAYEYGRNPDSDLGTYAGQLSEAVTQGLDDSKAIISKNDDWSETIRLDEQTNNINRTIGILSTIPLPVVPEAVSIVSTDVRAGMLDLIGDPRNQGGTDPYESMKQDYDSLTKGTARSFHLADGYVDGRPIPPDLKELDTFFDRQGNPNWEAIQRNPDRFKMLLNRLPDDLESDYQLDYSQGADDSVLDESKRSQPTPRNRPPS